MTEQTVPGRLAVKRVFVASIILLSLYMVNLLLGTLGEEAPGVDFVVYKAYYNSTEGSVTARLDQNGSLPAYNVRVFVDWGTEWSFQRVDPEEFIRIRFEKMLDASDLPYWEELYMEWEYLDDREGMKHDDRVLFIILTRNDIVT
jgi:hypothetical protein